MECLSYCPESFASFLFVIRGLLVRPGPLVCGSCLERWVDGEVVLWEVYWMVRLIAFS